MAASRSSPRSTTSWAERRSSTVPRCTGCAPRTSASFSTTTAFRRLADHLRRARAVLHEGRALLRGAWQPRRGSNGRIRERPVSVPSRLARAADPAALGRPRVGRPPPVPRTLRDSAERVQHAVQRVRPLRQLRRLRVRRAWEVGCRGTRRAARARASERRARHECESRQAPDERRRLGRYGCRRRAGWRDEDVYGRPRDSGVWRGEHRPPATRLGDGQASERSRQRLGPGGTQLHVPQQPGRPRALTRGEPDRVPEDPRPQRLLLRGQRPRLPAGQHSDGRKVAGADVQGRAPRRDEARSAMDAREGSEARDRLLALDRGPARCPRTGSRSTRTAS